ncbi:MAG: glycosyltransferase family 2 protein [Ignavibacteria bacterium]
MKLSSIIIAKNEKNNIARCINSQLECIDEIIVIVDDATTDITLQIVNSFGVKAYTTKWLGYSKSKEFAISKTTNDWILWIDADEALTEYLQKELMQFKLAEDTNYAAYSIPRKANFLGKWIMHSGWYPGRIERLFNKKKAYFSQKDVHEHLIINGRIGRLNGDIEHYTDPSIKHYYEKFNNYTSLAANELYQKNRPVSIFDLLVRPTFLFFKMYIIKYGFLDGMQGFILAVFSANYVFTKYAKLLELKKFKRK